MSNKKTYWKGLEELKNDPQFVKHADKEFVDLGTEKDPGHSRRDFLRMMGFGVSAVTLAACEAPLRKAIPYIQKPVDVDPGIPNYYASTYINGGDYCSIVVKTREGRPIKIEGNPLSGVTKGGTSAQVEASVLSLYDDYRLRGPEIGNDPDHKKNKSTWEVVDKEVLAKLNEIAGKGGKIRIVSNSVISPSTKASIGKFITKYSTTEHIQYDQVSCYGMLKANEESMGGAFIPSYDFTKASIIVSIGADFLGTWISPIEFSKQYGWTRELGEDKKEMSRHYQFESNLSLTGANADYRTAIKPSQEGLVVAQLYNLIAAKAGKGALSASIDKINNLEKAANDLWENHGKALVVSGSNDKSVQIVINGINEMLGSYGSTILPQSPVNYRQGNDEAMAKFISDTEGGQISGIIFFNCNPVYDHPMGEKLGESLKNVALTVSTSYTRDETSSAVSIRTPDHHYLESWNDAEPKKGFYSVSQPAITPIFVSRQAQESFLVWAGESNPDYFTIVSDNWKNWFFAKQSKHADELSFWDQCLYDGVFEATPSESKEEPKEKSKEKSKEKKAEPKAEPRVGSFSGDVSAAASAISSNYKADNTGFELVIYENYGVGNGVMANNPLLQELPDPITKATWDNYITISQKDAAAKGFTMDDGNTQIANLTVGGKTIEVPVVIQPGQAIGTIGLPLGYGRTKVGRVGENIGVTAYPFITMVNGSLSLSVTSGVNVEKSAKKYQIAQTQTHQTYMGRENVIQESVLEEYKKNPFAGREDELVSKWDEKVQPSTLSLWKGHEYKNHHWGMAIDMNTCSGCGACVVACNVENNIPLVGKDEVLRRREMHWLRIDRYYSSEAKPDDRKGLEIASDNPEVVFQPMLCQHCNNASCETVCPVAATTHSTEGLNQMTYNRCIGTRYCANNCPYKVRRFNWFKYHDNQKFQASNPSMNTDLGRMVLNPEVTVRSRGVMEKCSFCAQRIQAGKLTAKRERRPVKDGEVVTACMAACSTGAILFGDMNDPESKLSKLLKIGPDPNHPNGIDKVISNPRAYRVLEEIGVKPNIFYLRKIRNKEKEAEKV
jgi:MoCo/4Fe-4S cofactor protein with predicted Tat translocation signal